ncbi:TPA: hypothetical protein ACQYF6_000120 [Vibrio parahaemolyticus]|nr:hypothetical protein [Vibrio parahaemolyticus]ELA9329801.1 hypothetical protein [Vibrio parahaemolyticus]
MSENINFSDKSNAKILLEWIGILTLWASLCGLINQYSLLSNFSVSLADYADIDDFLVASINVLSPVNYALAGKMMPALGSIAFIWLIGLPMSIVLITISSQYYYWRYRLNKVGREMKGKPAEIATIKSELSAEFKKQISSSLELATPLYILFIFTSVLMFSHLLGQIHAEYIKKVEPCRVKVQIRHPTGGFSPFDKQSQLVVITGLNSTIFFLEKVSDDNASDDSQIATERIVVYAIPTSNIAQMTMLCTES